MSNKALILIITGILFSVALVFAVICAKPAYHVFKGWKEKLGLLEAAYLKRVSRLAVASH